MNIFKNKGVVRLYAFITACLIIITLLLSGINVCAETNFNYADAYSFADIQYLHYANNETDFQYATNTAITECQYLIDNNLFTCPESRSINTSVFPNYAIIYNSSNHRFYVMYADEDAFLTVYPNDDGVIALNSSNFDANFRYYISRWKYDTSNPSNSGYIETLDDFTNSNPAHYNVYENSEDTTSENFYQCSLYGYQIVASTCPIYVKEDGTRDLYLDDVENINDTVSNTQPGEDATNNMYFKDFNISYSVSGLYSGNVVCYGTLNDYQKEHLDEFALTYTFTFEYKGYQPRVSGNTYNFTKVYSYQQTLSDFYDNSSSKTFTLKDIMQNINTTDVHSEYGNLYQLIYYFSNLRINQDSDLDGIYPKNNEFVWQKARMKTTVFIVSANDSPSDILNSSDLHSNSFSKAYNFLDGKSSTYSDGITSNNNPYQTNESGTIENQQQLDNQENGVASSDIPSSQGDNGGSGTSVVTGDNNIVINNNPTFNNDGSVSGSGGGSSDGGVASTFYNTFNPFKTLFSSLNGDNNVISDETAETIGSNRFISVMSSTFSFIPDGMWTALTTFFIASLSILVVAVVIRVLLDLL